MFCFNSNLLRSINNPYLFKKAGAALANLYLNGNGVEYDAREALDIACIAKQQADLHARARDFDRQLIDIQSRAFAKIRQENFIKFLRMVLDTPIHFVDVEAIDVILESRLDDEEYSYLVNEYSSNNEQTELFNKIKRKLRHPVIGKELLGACNKMIYIGSDEKGHDNYFNFEECGNMFIHGTCGAGKTWYLYSIFKRLKSKETYKKTNIVFWSFKPFEFKGWCDEYLIEDPHDFVKRILVLSNSKDRETLIFIDEFVDFMSKISDEEKNVIIDILKNSKSRNICFVCCSQNMSNVIKDYEQYVSTRVCMMCYKKEESVLMIGSGIANSINEHGYMYVKNNDVAEFIEAKKMKVIKI